MMKFTVSTVVLQDMVLRASKGVGNNKLIPLTGLMVIQLQDRALQLITTDANNYLYIKKADVEGDDFYAVVSADTFSRLISKMTCEFVTLELVDNALKVIGNGTYLIELSLDEDGTPIKFPNPVETFRADSETVWNRADVDTILSSVKPAIATTLEVPCYTGYYIGDSVVATNVLKIANFDAKLTEAPVLISQETMNLLAVFGTGDITVLQSDANIVFVSDDATVFGEKMSGIEDYAIDAIMGVVSTAYPFYCDISKIELIQLLDRLMLFVDRYDKNGINLEFCDGQLSVSSKASSAVELISYISQSGGEFRCVADIEMLMQAIKAIRGSVLHIEYGVDNALKFTEDDVTLVIALLEEE